MTVSSPFEGDVVSVPVLVHPSLPGGNQTAVLANTIMYQFELSDHLFRDDLADVTGSSRARTRPRHHGHERKLRARDARHITQRTQRMDLMQRTSAQTSASRCVRACAILIEILILGRAGGECGEELEDHFLSKISLVPRTQVEFDTADVSAFPRIGADQSDRWWNLQLQFQRGNTALTTVYETSHQLGARDRGVAACLRTHTKPLTTQQFR